MCMLAVSSGFGGVFEVCWGCHGSANISFSPCSLSPALCMACGASPSARWQGRDLRAAGARHVAVQKAPFQAFRGVSEPSCNSRSLSFASGPLAADKAVSSSFFFFRRAASLTGSRVLMVSLSL